MGRMATRTGAATTMRDDSDIIRRPVPGAAFPAELMVWLSPAFPTGAFAYSQGLETAVARGVVSGRDELGDWLEALLVRGMLWSDLVIVSLVWRAEMASEVRELGDLALALQPSAERAEEARVLGRNFHDALVAGWPEAAAEFAGLERTVLSYPVAVGLASRSLGLALDATLEAYAHAFVSNAISAAIRLGVIGQFDGQRVHARLFEPIRGLTAAAMVAREDDVATAQFAADIDCMNHETLNVRLFRS